MDLAFLEDTDTTDSASFTAVPPLLHFDSLVLLLLSRPRPQNRGTSTETRGISSLPYPLAVGTDG